MLLVESSGLTANHYVIVSSSLQQNRQILRLPWAVGVTLTLILCVVSEWQLEGILLIAQGMH